MIQENKYNHFVTNEKDATYRQMFESFAKDSIEKITELWSIGAIKSILLDDIGFSVLPLGKVKKELESGNLKVIRHNFEFDLFRSLLLTRKQSWQNPLVDLFIEQTKIHFKQ
ncbi:LysR substrate-binding domain-containing protein [Jeotgalicoccus sp. WY2]|uniref:LysR substrate-binding domain-containing protein n=1 Tax=Jeotgalicoccus sp. WY2 TaxID=2708346 RepID=UPI001BD5ED74|nr:LysR substrate-binding domain-containing protein [Jeotgalicoccus sp. WY2]